MSKKIVEVLLVNIENLKIDDLNELANYISLENVYERSTSKVGQGII